MHKPRPILVVSADVVATCCLWSFRRYIKALLASSPLQLSSWLTAGFSPFFT